MKKKAKMMEPHKIRWTFLRNLHTTKHVGIPKEPSQMGEDLQAMIAFNILLSFSNKICSFLCLLTTRFICIENFMMSDRCSSRLHISFHFM
jgi:hypothetical protein